jgi:NADH-quinone oxidoreductase subunit J
MELFFYIFASLIILGSVGVVFSKNSVHSVLWLIWVFCNTAGIFVLLGAEFLAMSLVVVYVGAVAVLFLFVVMMLGNKYFRSSETSIQKKHLFIILTLLTILFADLTLVISAASNSFSPVVSDPTSSISNTHLIGSILYTDYVIAFQLSGVILFVAMIGCILLTYRGPSKRKRQNVDKQLSRSKDTAMDLVNIENHQGVKDIQYD